MQKSLSRTPFLFLSDSWKEDPKLTPGKEDPSVAVAEHKAPTTTGHTGSNPRRRSFIMPKKETDPEAEEKEKLEDLQKRYRLMEGDRKSYSEESQNIIRKQRYVICRLGTACAALQLSNQAWAQRQLKP
jgi:hypothetical protein